MPRQELGRVPQQATRGKRRRRSPEGGGLPIGGREERRFAAAVTAAHFPILFPGWRSAAILRHTLDPFQPLARCFSYRALALRKALAFVPSWRTFHLGARCAQTSRIPTSKRKIPRSNDRGDCSHTRRPHIPPVLCAIKDRCTRREVRTHTGASVID